MNQPPMTLTTAERAALLTPCPHCGHTIEDHGGTITCWTCSNDGAPACPANFEALLVERVAGIVAAQVEERLAADAPDETAFMEALGGEARKYAVSRPSLAGSEVWTLTLAQLPSVALTELRRALDQGGRATGGSEG